MGWKVFRGKERQKFLENVNYKIKSERTVSNSTGRETTENV